jgi:hypothetical protein
VSLTTRRARRARKESTVTDPTPKPVEPVLSKNLAFAAVALIVLFGVVGVLLLHLFRPDASATFIQTIVTFAGILTTAITLLYGLGKVGDRIDVVQKQTNGTLTSLREEIERKENVIREQNDRLIRQAEKIPPGAA